MNVKVKQDRSYLWSNAVKVLIAALMLWVMLIAAGCGAGNSSSTTNQGALSGNWQITLNRNATTVPQNFSGFLLQSGKAVSGSVILGGNCHGVGPVTGTTSGPNVSLTINEFGQDLSLSGTSANGSMSGQFSTLAGGCTAFPNTGAWTAVQIPPLKGSFHGTLASGANGTLNVTGSLQQGPNVGASNASVSGSIIGTGNVFCNYIPATATITGVISGTQLNLNLYDSTGALIGQIPSTLQPAVLSPDATSLNGSYIFGGQSSNCIGDNGALQISFP
jgi:hypothetical protein